MKNTLLTSLAAGVVLFFWGFVSWTILPWHNSTIETYGDEAGVAEFMASQTPESGVYYLPGKTMGGDFSEEEIASSKALYETGPIFFVSAHLGGGKPMGLSMAKSFAIQFFSALAVVLLLKCGHVERFGCRWRAAVLVGVVIGIQANLPNMIWWSFPADFAWTNLADSVVAWTLAGGVIAKLIR